MGKIEVTRLSQKRLPVPVVMYINSHVQLRFLKMKEETQLNAAESL